MQCDPQPPIGTLWTTMSWILGVPYPYARRLTSSEPQPGRYNIRICNPSCYPSIRSLMCTIFFFGQLANSLNQSLATDYSMWKILWKSCETVKRPNKDLSNCVLSCGSSCPCKRACSLRQSNSSSGPVPSENWHPSRERSIGVERFHAA